MYDSDNASMVIDWAIADSASTTESTTKIEQIRDNQSSEKA